MKSLFKILLCKIIFLFVFEYAGAQKIIYRGWECIQLSNNSTSVIVSPTTGGRVVSFSIKGKEIIYSDPQQDGKTLYDYIRNPFDWDAGRFDYGPENYTNAGNRHISTWCGKWEIVEYDSHHLKIASPHDSLLGITSYREFFLSEEGSFLKIKCTMENTSKDEVSYHFWGRTLAKAGGVLFIPVRFDGSFPAKGWGLFNNTFERINHNPDDGRISVKNKVLSFEANKQSVIKGGSDAYDGWMLYQIDDLVFIKKFKVFKDLSYRASENMTTIFFSDTKMIEFEPVSPLYTLSPNEKISFEENWNLLIVKRKITPDNILNYL